jgi:type I restriction enzyme, S subunit
MIALSTAYPKAFTVEFKDLDRWSVSSFFRIRWRWPQGVIRTLSDALEKKNDEVKRKGSSLDGLRLVTLHFDGEMEPRDLGGKDAFKGKLFSAQSGDVIYSKIDVRNGAIGVVPSDLPRIAVSSEYPVYGVREQIAVPEYVKLLFRSSIFQRQINSMISGASGRKRVQPVDLEELQVPLPPIQVQERIVEFWQKAQDSAVKSREKIDAIEREIPGMVYQALGTPVPGAGTPLPRMMALPWRDLERWSFNYLARLRQGLLGFTVARYPIHPLERFVKDTANGFCIRPVQTPTPYKMLKLNALTPDGLDVEQVKFVDVPASVAERFRIRRGDLLICRSVGSYDHIAKCALVDGDWDNILFPDIIIRIILTDGLLPEYVREVIQTPLGRSFFQSNARTAVGMWKIGADDIRSFPIPVPPLDVQRQIIQSVGRQRRRIAEEKAKAQENLAVAVRETEEMILGARAA